MHRFLKGPETDQVVVSKIKDAIEEKREITIQINNYTKSGNKTFFFLFRFFHDLSWLLVLFVSNNLEQPQYIILYYCVDANFDLMACRKKLLEFIPFATHV